MCVCVCVCGSGASAWPSFELGNLTVLIKNAVRILQMKRQINVLRREGPCGFGFRRVTQIETRVGNRSVSERFDSDVRDKVIQK